jgi:hypothetical protein
MDCMVSDAVLQVNVSSLRDNYPPRNLLTNTDSYQNSVSHLTLKSCVQTDL